MGGRGEWIYKVTNMIELIDGFNAIKAANGSILVQNYVQSIKTFDYRICVCMGKILFANTRTLLQGWFGSRSQGSKIESLDIIFEDVQQICLRACASINSHINCLDIVIGEQGPEVIENNPTPTFNQEYVKIYGFNPIEKIVNHILHSNSPSLAYNQYQTAK